VENISGVISMKWVYSDSVQKPIMSWCEEVDSDAMDQARNLANHPSIFKHVALMPDCHVGYGMPIGGVIACEKDVIPNAVGVDIGCGMGAIETSLHYTDLGDMRKIRSLMELIKTRVPVGEGHSHRGSQQWHGFEEFYDSLDTLPSWATEKGMNLDTRNLGTLGGGNHFIELQKDQDQTVWLMLHSGSRNLGHRIASHYHRRAQKINEKYHVDLPSKDLAFLPVDGEGSDYIRDMNFALAYAAENRRRMMEAFKESVVEIYGSTDFVQEINIHHNYANIENHFGRNVWVHRKGATSAQKNQMGIIPGSMGTSSYIVEGLGNEDSFASCSHGAGRVLGRKEACRTLDVKECNKAMEGIVFDRWSKVRGRNRKSPEAMWDLAEAPLAYKDIDEVIEAELDLIKPIVKLSPLGVIKG
jgi:tRNA-splicing ligase RtcB